MKLLTAIKRAAKKAEQYHGEFEYVVRRKYGLEREIRPVFDHISSYGEDDIRIDIQCSIEDLFSDDWIVEEG